MGTTSVVSVSSAPPPPVDLGTTLVAVTYSHGVVVGADSRTSVSGYVSHRYAHKLTPITPHCLVARSGSAADTQQLAHLARLECLSRRYRYGTHSASVMQVAHLLRSLVYGESNNDNGGVELAASLIVAGYDLDAERARIFTISSSGALLEESGGFAAAGSGSAFVLGFLDDRLRDNDKVAGSLLSEDEAVELCLQAVALAAQRDGSSGGVTRLHVCNANGVRELTLYPTARMRRQDAPSALDGFAAPDRGSVQHV